MFSGRGIISGSNSNIYGLLQQGGSYIVVILLVGLSLFLRRHVFLLVVIRVGESKGIHRSKQMNVQQTRQIATDIGRSQKKKVYSLSSYFLDFFDFFLGLSSSSSSSSYFLDFFDFFGLSSSSSSS